MDTTRPDNRDGGMVLNSPVTRTDGDRLGPTRTTGKEKKRLRLVEVSWIDAYTEGGWAEYAQETLETKTYGLLVKKTREWLTLAMSKEKGYWGNLWYIPTKNINNVRIIEEISIPEPESVSKDPLSKSSLSERPSPQSHFSGSSSS